MDPLSASALVGAVWLAAAKASRLSRTFRSEQLMHCEPVFSGICHWVVLKASFAFSWAQVEFVDMKKVFLSNDTIVGTTIWSLQV